MTTTSRDCDFIEGCPIFKYFRKFAQQVYMDIYYQGDYAICKRYHLRTSGETVPQNLLPHGGTLWDDGKRLPDPPAHD